VTDLLALAAELVSVPSPSHEEAPLCALVEERLRSLRHLGVERLGNNVVARTSLGRPMRLLVGGHLDTVPPDGNLPGRIEGDVLWGLGAADMKGGLAVMLALAAELDAPAVDVTWVFYECEEVESRYNGLGRLEREAPELLACDAAVLMEPTAARVEAGCQGSLRAVVTVGGVRAHTARAWVGRNAIHRLGEVLRRLEAYRPREPEIDGCRYREALQAVRVEGGVAGNVVPDLARLWVNHRFAPDRSPAEAEAHVREVVGDVDALVVEDVAPGAPPRLDHPLLGALVARTGEPPVAKLGWTDVARFAARGVPATNFGPGDPLLAHTSGERVSRGDLERVSAVLGDLLREGA
jgi:succinyl-diaminopimelate desuccinylase